MTKKEALANYLRPTRQVIEIEDIESTYDDCIFNWQGEEYLVVTDAEADERAAEYIRASVWAFQASWIADFTPEGIDTEEIESLRGDRCEAVNKGLIALINAGTGMQAFIDASIAADGRGHFLSRYDSEEHAEGSFFIYRLY